MSIAFLAKIGLIMTGVIVMVLTFLLHSAKKLTVNLAVAWEAIGIGLILVGTVPFFSSGCYLLARGTMIAMFLVGGLTIWGGFELSILISSLAMKNQELAMQISLLNQDSERMLKKLEELEKRFDQHLAGGNDLQK